MSKRRPVERRAWLKTGSPGKLLGMSSDGFLSQMHAALPIFDAFYAIEGPRAETRIRNRVTGLKQKSDTAGTAALFFVSFHLIVRCSLPRQLLLGLHFDPGSQSDNRMPCKVGK